MLLSPTIVKCYSKLLEIGSSICSRNLLFGRGTGGCSVQAAANCQKASLIVDVGPGACEEMHLAWVEGGPGGVLCRMQNGCWELG